MLKGLCGVLAIAASWFLIRGMSERDIVHIYVDSSVPDVYEVFESKGPSWVGLTSSTNNYFPREESAGKEPVSFPVSSHMFQFRIDPGTQPVKVAIVRVCLERTLFITRCISGADLIGYVDRPHDATLSQLGSQMLVESRSSDPYLELSPRLVSRLQPGFDPGLWIVRSLLALAAAGFFFCFFYSWIAPLAAFWNFEATLVFAAAAGIRALFFATHPGGAASDSVLFENYLHQNLFTLPGIRGIVYPAFLSLFPFRAPALYATQMLLGALGAVIVLLLLRSLKKAYWWDSLCAIIAASLPTLLAMESIALSESLSLFLVLTALAAFSHLQFNGARTITMAGMGTSCALLYNTKPQFGYVIVLFFVSLLILPRLRSLRGLLAFAAPVLALELFVIFINSSAGNFRGVTSTLGYSLFDQAQQFLTCPNTDPDPRIQYYCQARAALPPNGNPTGYTAWVIYPAMHGQQLLFHHATAGYADLSFRLIAAHPAGYLINVWKSFRDFWTQDVPMVPYALGSAGTQVLLPLDRFVRFAIEILFFLSIPILLFKHPWRDDGRRFSLCLILIATVLGSALVAALAEAGNEQGRFAVPILPLLPIVIIFSIFGPETALFRRKSRSPIAC